MVYVAKPLVAACCCRVRNGRKCIECHTIGMPGAVFQMPHARRVGGELQIYGSKDVRVEGLVEQKQM